MVASYSDRLNFVGPCHEILKYIELWWTAWYAAPPTPSPNLLPQTPPGLGITYVLLNFLKNSFPHLLFKYLVWETYFLKKWASQSVVWLPGNQSQMGLTKWSKPAILSSFSGSLL